MKNKIITFMFIIYLLVFLVLHIVFEDNVISFTERRELTSFPKFSLSSEYVTKIDKYLLDQFPYRNGFRSIKAEFNYNIMNRLENNGIYLKNDGIYKSNYPTNVSSINNFVSKINSVKELLSKDNNVYIMVVPDKNYYLDDDNFLHIDYDYIYNEINKLGIENIDVTNILSLDDYYKTDTHWRQENLFDVVKTMSSFMNFDYKYDKYNFNEYDNFYGVYYGESAINREGETLVYLTSDTINNASVKYLENDKLTSVYNLDKLDSFDSYEVYLDGASSYIEINNPYNKKGRELVIFRDSFGSSIAPLLINYYSKITLIDNRYISSDYFIDYIKFNNQDVLFLYSTLFINSSNGLKG